MADRLLAQDLDELNRKRLRVLAPLMAIVHVVHVVLFRVPPSLRPSLTADQLRFRDGIVAAHALMIPFALALSFVVWRVRAGWLVRVAAPLMAVAYLVHGAACAGFDQIVSSNLTAYVGYVFGIAVVLALSPAEAVVAYGIGALTMVLALFHLQRSAATRTTALPQVFSLTVVGVALSSILQAARKRDFSQRRTIERQRQELAELNASLERRVAEQVAQIQAQVKARSTELALALDKIARSRIGGESEARLAKGTVLGGRFVLDDFLGEGGMGAVYRGRDNESGAHVAIKIIQAGANRLEAVRRFVREAGAAATVTHPAVVRMIHVDVDDDGRLFQVQELVDGETLARRLGQPWPAAEAARLVGVLAEALAAAHAVGIVHRDVKPDNVMLTPSEPGLKLLDFGIAKLYDAVSLGDETMRGIIMGTPAYMAPEQVAGETVGDRADVYACGVVLYRLLAARLPFDAASPHEMMMCHATATPLSLVDVEPEVAPPLALLVARCLQKSPRERPSAAELARQLGALADEAGAPPLDHVARRAAVEPRMEATVRARAATPRSSA